MVNEGVLIVEQETSWKISRMEFAVKITFVLGDYLVYWRKEPLVKHVTADRISDATAGLLPAGEGML